MIAQEAFLNDDCFQNLGQVLVTPLSIWIVTFLVLGRGGIFDGNLGILVLQDSRAYLSLLASSDITSPDTSSLLSKSRFPTQPLLTPKRGAPHYCREGLGFCSPLGHSPYLPGWER